jgi:hypothetical protein
MAGEGDEFIVVNVLVGRDGGLLNGAREFPLTDEPLQNTIDIVSEFGLGIESDQIGRVGYGPHRGGQTLAGKLH